MEETDFHLSEWEEWSQTFVPHCVLLITYSSVSFCLVLSNVEQLSEQFQNSQVDISRMPSFNYSAPSSVSLEDYRSWFKLHGGHIPGNLTNCDLELEMQKVRTFWTNVNKKHLTSVFCVTYIVYKN